MTLDILAPKAVLLRASCSEKGKSGNKDKRWCHSDDTKIKKLFE